MRPLRILCATASPTQRRELLDTLARTGSTIECVRDGRQALDCVAQHGSFDVVFVTHPLPALGGLALVRRMRHAGFDGRVVVLCAAAPSSLVSAYRALGVTTLLIEPAPAVVRAALAPDGG